MDMAERLDMDAEMLETMAAELRRQAAALRTIVKGAAKLEAERMSTEDVARIAGSSRETVRRECARGRIPGAVAVDGRGMWRIPTMAAMEWVARRKAAAATKANPIGQGG